MRGDRSHRRQDELTGNLELPSPHCRHGCDKRFHLAPEVVEQRLITLDAVYLSLEHLSHELVHGHL